MKVAKVWRVDWLAPLTANHVGTPSHSSLRESPPAFSDTQSVRASLSRVMGQSQGGGVPSKNSLHRRSTTGQSGIGPTPSPDTLARLPLSLRGLPLASQLILASEHGQIEAIRILLDLGVSPSCRDENSTLLTPLIQAARHGHTAVVELLVERGARLEDRDPDIGGTAVFHAAINGWYETVKVLIALGADPNAPEWTGCTPIFAASFHGHLEVVETLIESGASIDVPGPSGSPIHAAIEGRQMEVLKMLLKRAHDVNAVDAVGRTPLWIASQAGLLPVLELLLDHGADIDKPSDEGTRPLWAAIVNDHPEIACRLVERGCDVQAPLPRGAMGGKLPTPPSTASKSLGFTPLHGAAHRNHARLAHALLERQADPTLEDETQHTPLHLAAMMGNAAVVDVILWHKPLLINSPSATLMRTPLFLAALWNSMEVARLLIDYGADVEAISDPRTIQATALRAAVQGNHHSMVELLLTRGSANPNARAADGSTCLHVTVSNGNVRIAGLLISHGADVDARLSGAGETPLHLATRRRKRNVKSSSSSTSSGGESNNDTLTIIRLLLAANASINLAEERAGLTPLHLAAREGDLAIVALLIGHGADLEALTHSGFSPLAIASLNGRVEVVRELLQCGASPFATSFEGVSVMHAAVMGVGVSGGSSGGATAEASARILRMLLEKGAEVDTTDARGETPLGIASRGGNLYAVKVLVEAGASLDQLAWPKGVPPE
ncbi:ankyrin repeat-containing domain protein [Zopfochytrium polystomum]|nr:ankyrin repeat-containing domain protein [Zopfochytrium polystomum]